MELIKENINLIRGHLIHEDGGSNFLGKMVKVVLIIILVKILIRLANKFIRSSLELNKKFRKEPNDSIASQNARIETLAGVLYNLVRFIIIFIGLVWILSIFNINTKSILATAGIGGLAIGFGAQSLVKDVITGFFIISEDQFRVGDHVEVCGNEGLVEDIGLRITKVRGFSGVLHIIPNGEIKMVRNMSRGPQRAMVDISIAYEEDVERAVDLLQKAVDKMAKDDVEIIEKPTVLGIQSFDDSGVRIRIVAKTVPLSQWSTERNIRKLIKETLENGDIEIPYNKIQIVSGGDIDA